MSVSNELLWVCFWFAMALLVEEVIKVHEHGIPQSVIDRARFGKFAGNPMLGAADYKLVHHASNGRSVYSFCMCPGGKVIAATSEPAFFSDSANAAMRSPRPIGGRYAACWAGVPKSVIGSEPSPWSA